TSRQSRPRGLRLEQALKLSAAHHLACGLVRVVALGRAAGAPRGLVVESEPAIDQQPIVAIVRQTAAGGAVQAVRARGASRHAVAADPGLAGAVAETRAAV